MSEQVEILSREMEAIKKLIEIPELKSTKSEL